MVFLCSLSWDIFKKHQRIFGSENQHLEFPLIHQVASKVLQNKIGRHVGYCWNTGSPFQEERSPQVSTMFVSTPPNHVFQTSQTKQIARSEKKTSSQQPPEFFSFPSFPHLDHRHIIKARHWSCRWWDGHPMSQRVTGHTWTKSSYRGFNCRGSWYHRHHHPGNGCCPKLIIELTEWCNDQSMIQKCYEMLCKTPNHSFRPVHYWIGAYKIVKQKY